MGRPMTEAVAEQQSLINSLRQTVAAQGLVIDYICRVAGISDQAAGIHAEAMKRTADIENPAQPVPNPPAQPAAETTEQAVTPEAYDNPQVPGQTPGSVQHLPADATGTPMDPGTTLPTAPYGNLTDVTAPVAGTQSGEVPLEQTRTEVDVRVGDPMNPQIAYPWTIEQQQAQASNRTMAALRLARLQIQSGIEQGDDLAVCAKIEADSKMTIEAMEAQIQTLAGVMRAQSSRGSRPANVVPRPTAPARTTPSLVQAPSLSTEASLGSPDDAEDIFI